MFHSTIYTVFFFLFNFIQWTMWYAAASRIFPPKLPRWLTYVVAAACICAAIYLDAYPWADFPALRTMSFLLFFTLPVVLLCRGKVVRKLIASVFILVSMVVTELIMSFITPKWELQVALRHYDSPSVLFFYVEYLICSAILLLIVIRAMEALERKTENSISDRERLLFLLFPISQYILLTGWYLNFVEDLSLSQLAATLLVVLFCVVTDILLYRAIMRTSDNARLRAQNELMEQQISARNEYYQLLAQNYSDMSKLRHDIASHVYTIRILLEDGKRAEALQYAEELQHSPTVQTLLSECHNTVIGSFLRHRIDELTARGVRVTAEIRLPAQCGISDTDLIIAFGNMLDNAAEACAKASDPYLTIRSGIADHFLHIEMENSCCPGDKGGKKVRRVPYLERGIGSSILQSLADKYGGNYMVHREASSCQTTLVLKEAAL